MTSIALVLGGGGAVGGAFEAGALAGIAEATDWDARSADLLVGTSAGATITTALRVGISPVDQHRRAQGLPLSPEGEAILADLPREPIDLPPPISLDPRQLLRPSAPWLVAPAFLAPGPVRPGLLAGLLPRGRVPTSLIGERFRRLAKVRWPDDPTWICAVRMRDGKRVVFGRDDVDVPDIATAVEASSAVPGYFEPVRIGSHSYFDGGAFSATNADLVAGLGFDLVIVVSPMSAVSAAITRTPAGAARGLNARVLAREVRAIRDRGTPVLAIQPTRADLQLMGGNPLDVSSLPQIARRAYDSVRAYVDRREVADRVALLRAAEA